MENSIYKELTAESKTVAKLSHLGWKMVAYFFVALMMPIFMIVLLFVPVVGWVLYPMVVYGGWKIFNDIRRLRKMDGFRFKKIYVTNDNEHVEVKDNFYALMKDDKIVNVMNIVDVSKNKDLRLLLATQFNKKNELLSINLTQKEFFDYHTGGVLTRGI